MAKADKKTKDEKPKKPTRKKTEASTAHKKAASSATAKKKSSKAAKAKTTADDAGKKAKASTPAATTDSEAQAQSLAGGTFDPAWLPAQQGKIGVFGGPKDRGIKPDDKLALPTGKHFIFERVRSLNPNGFYCAMRWDYHILGKSIGEGQRWWANKKLQITNPANGTAVVVRAVDYGPPESTGLAIAVSPGAADALGVNVGDEVEITFADPRLPLGVVE